MANDIVNSTVTLQDTSQYTYRNSSEKHSGFTFEGGFTNEDRDRTTDVDEDETQNTQSLDAACRQMIKDMVTTLKHQVDNSAAEKDHLVEKAHYAWDRAVSLYPEFQTNLSAEIDDLKADMLARICQWTDQWSRMAGSSLNCQVQQMKIRAETDLARRLAAVIANKMHDQSKHETSAIQQAFQKEFQAHWGTRQIDYGHMSNLLAILKGANIDTIRERDVVEQVDETVNQIRAMGNYFSQARSIADNSGEYAGNVDDLAAAATAIAGA